MENTRGRKRLAVIGAGMAANACVEEISRLAPDGFEITVFGAEKHLNYNRVLLSYVLTGEKSLDDISLHKKQWYEERGINLLTGSRVAEIRRGRKVIVTGNGLEADYDKLIISTGSVPFVPPIKGVDKKGVVSFRDIDDCEKIKKMAGKGARAVVLGGGLLGLEAAHGLKNLGMEVTVVHLMDRLMERQLDMAAADFLKEDIEKLGIEVLTAKKTQEVVGNGKIEGLRFDDGSTIEASLLVLSVGIKPNIELARSSGIYCERGIVVSDTMQTYDPAVYAIGECVQHRGATFGLVAPIFEQAKVVANHLAGDSRLTFRNRPTSARLKVPGIELYSAGTVDNGAGVETIEYLDKGLRRYKKLFLKENRISGIIMYGDTGDGPRLFSHLIEEEDISHKRHSLLFGEAPSDGTSVKAMPDDTIVCGCNGVTKKMIVDAIEKKGLFTREDVKRETKATGSCGGCSNLVDRILEATLGANFQGSPKPVNICGCTKYTRDDVLKNIREKGLKSVKDVMETLGWETVGCDKCRPALNYYVSMVWPKDSEDDLTSRLVNERAHANIQKDGTYSVVPRMFGGVTNSGELRRIADAADKYNVPLVKLTGGQRVALIGVKKESLADIWRDLEMPSGYAYGKALRTVKTCVGSAYCRYGTQDSLSLGIALENVLNGLWMPAKVKIGVTGCPRNCAESDIKDFGVVGVSGGWEVHIGGCGGIELKGTERLCIVKTAEKVIKTACAYLQFYREDAHYGERTFKWVQRIGLNEIKKRIIEDIGSRDALVSRLKDALSASVDPWKERIGA
ncbi:MAG: NAD(P)/FAD-dependent oxidoreductase [Deltaproteobacteria bacterium]|nr:NAD(P)/FAD-dependent oxidoreductase [Deltaproteobacteria bacterium]